MSELPPNPLAAIAHAKQLLTLAADEYRAAIRYGRPLDEAEAALCEAGAGVEDAYQAIRRDAVALIIADAASSRSSEVYAGLVRYAAKKENDR